MGLPFFFTLSLYHAVALRSSLVRPHIFFSQEAEAVLTALEISASELDPSLTLNMVSACLAALQWCARIIESFTGSAHRTTALAVGTGAMPASASSFQI